MQNLQTRALSAFIALFFLFGLVYFFKNQGIYFFSIIIAIKGILEQSKLSFHSENLKIFKNLFVFVSLVFLILILFFNQEKQLGIPIISVFIMANSLGLILHKKFKSINDIQLFSFQFIVGFIYSVIFPILVISLLKNENGIYWYFCLLTVVFTGDVGAYIFGTLWGKIKLAPELSPKKSLQGSLGGLLFSSLAGCMFSLLIPQVSWVILLLLGFFGGLLGQIGDFYESLMKRIAGVKDSGTIMPGHGGVLDRVDGLYFASSLFYIVINYIIN